MDEKDKLLNILFDHLEEKYPAGLYEWLSTQRPHLDREITELENRINECYGKDGCITDFKGLLRSYWIAHIKAIQEFTKNNISKSYKDTSIVNQDKRVSEPLETYTNPKNPMIE